jgi:predicted house-cleaning noncanonical NTP pyrophosphatase (MazG superfamily)
MKIYIDGKEEKFDFKEEISLKEVVLELRKQLALGNQVITSFKVDGKLISVLDERLKDIALDKESKIEITTANPRDLTISGIIDSLGYLPHLKENLQKTIAEFSRGKQREGMNLLINCIDGLNWFNTIIIGVEKILGIDLIEFNVGGESIANKKVKLADVLRDLLSSLQNQDMVMVSDLIEYELVPQIEDWINVVSELIKVVDKKTN